MSAGDPFTGLLAQLPTAQGRARAELAGMLLAAAGERIRTGAADVDDKLKSLGKPDVEAWISGVDCQAIGAELYRAAEAAFEAVLADDASEAAEWRSWAVEALHGRDSLDAALVALSRWEKVAGAECAQSARERVAQSLKEIDSRGPSLARRLVGINSRRRSMRDQLQPEHRARAWWWSERADCDALTSLWKEANVAVDVTAHCGACARDRENARLAEKPPGACATEQELWDLDAGEMALARKRLIEKHALGCSECALALAALQTSLADDDSASPTVSFIPPAPKTLASRDECVVLLFRKPEPRLLISPAPGRKLAAASLQAGAEVLSAHATSQGLEVSLRGIKSQKVRLKIQPASGVALELDVEI